MKRSPLTIAIGAALIVVFALLLFMFQVRKSECAVVTSFGKVAETETEPGPYFRWPWPIQNVYLLGPTDSEFRHKIRRGDAAGPKHSAAFVLRGMED